MLRAPYPITNVPNDAMMPSMNGENVKSSMETTRIVEREKMR
jgi:hypothetical protein